MQLPEHITNAIESNVTSLGENPAFPPRVNGYNFINKLLSNEYESVKGKEQSENPTDELTRLMHDCMEKESGVKPALEKLCSDIVLKMFRIPEDTIQIDAKLTNDVDKSRQRISPEDDSDFSFDDINDMERLGKEVYKRRLLNAIAEGASEWYAYDINNYIQELWKISPDIPSLYNRIINLSNVLMYDTDETRLDQISGSDGTVNVLLNSAPNMINIKSYGVIFPILLQQTIKGILEVAILQGLPEEKEKATFIMGKSDFRMADIWDSRLGVPLWKRIADCIEKAGYDVNEIGLNFVLMELSLLDVDSFNQIMREVFAGTKAGVEKMNEMCSYIENEREQDRFNDYVDQQNSTYPIEDGYFSMDELITDDVDNGEITEESENRNTWPDWFSPKVEDGFVELYHGLSNDSLDYVLTEGSLMPRECSEGCYGLWFSTQPTQDYSSGKQCQISIRVPANEIGTGKRFSIMNSIHVLTRQPVPIDEFDFQVRKINNVKIDGEMLAHWKHLLETEPDKFIPVLKNICHSDAIWYYMMEMIEKKL